MLVDCKRCKGEGIIIVEEKEWDCCGGVGRLKVKEI